jgi:hypothetical protein
VGARITKNEVSEVPLDCKETKYRLLSSQCDELRVLIGRKDRDLSELREYAELELKELRNELVVSVQECEAIEALRCQLDLTESEKTKALLENAALEQVVLNLHEELKKKDEISDRGITGMKVCRVTIRLSVSKSIHEHIQNLIGCSVFRLFMFSRYARTALRLRII